MARDHVETWTGPYSYLEMTFEEQNKAVAVNHPFSSDYIPAACYLISSKGNVRLWDRNQFSPAA